MILEEKVYKNHFLTSFRLEVFFSHLWVDMRGHVGSVLLGKWLFLSLYSMYEIHKRNSIGYGLLNHGTTFCGLCTFDWYGWDVGRDENVCSLIQCNYENCFMENQE